jgi:peptidylprolyl isomerase
MGKKLKACPECGAEVAAANLERHVRRVHGSDEAREERDERRRKSLAERRKRRDGPRRAGLLVPLVFIALVAAGAGGLAYYQFVLLPQQGGGGGNGGGSGDFAVFDISIDGQPVGSFKWKFRPDAAPITAKRIKELVQQGFYGRDAKNFHRIIPGFVAQGGDPRGDGTGGSGQLIPWENSPLKNRRLTVAMARGADINSADSQFFINLIDNTALDKGGASAKENQYVVFAEIVSGGGVVDQMAAVGTSGGTPTKPVVMTRAYLTSS